MGCDGGLETGNENGIPAKSGSKRRQKGRPAPVKEDTRRDSFTGPAKTPTHVYLPPPSEMGGEKCAVADRMQIEKRDGYRIVPNLRPGAPFKLK